MSSETIASIAAERRKALAAKIEAQEALDQARDEHETAVRNAEIALKNAGTAHDSALATYRSWDRALNAVSPRHPDLEV